MANVKLAEKLEPVIEKLEQAEDEDAIRKVFEGTEEAAGADELSEEDLENVAGGLREVEVLKWLIKNTKTGQLSWKGTKMCARCFYDYAKYGDAYRTYSREQLRQVNADLDKAIPGWMKKINEIF